MSRARIALVGDHSERHTAHRAIPIALELARRRSGADVEWEWVATGSLNDAPRDLAGFSAAWFVPATPYANTQGALDAIRWAREGNRPALGTCGGFQHMVIEFARNVAGIAGADTSETNPGGSALVVTKLSCSMVEKTGAVRFLQGSLIGSAYGAPGANEGYRCNYGFNPEYRAALEKAGLRFTAWDEAGDIRGAELPSHPFYAGVLFQPERAALTGEVPPLVLAFVNAAASGSRA
jgi:CTP synthase (UTP-ammonia lyase)